MQQICQRVGTLSAKVFLHPLIFVGRLLLLVIVLPIVIVVIPVLSLLGLNKLNAGPDYVAEYLEKFIGGTEGEWDWDDFCSVALKDEGLDEIREQACRFGPPAVLGENERDELRRLLAEVRGK